MNEGGGYCVVCDSHYSDGDGKVCPGCDRELCYLHFPAGQRDAHTVCNRCENEDREDES